MDVGTVVLVYFTVGRLLPFSIRPSREGFVVDIGFFLEKPQGADPGDYAVAVVGNATQVPRVGDVIFLCRDHVGSTYRVLEVSWAYEAVPGDRWDVNEMTPSVTVEPIHSVALRRSP